MSTEEIILCGMFAMFIPLLLTGFHVALVMASVGLSGIFAGIVFGVFLPFELRNITPRIWSGVAENIVLVAIPMFIFMGITLEKTDIATKMLGALQHLMHRAPAGLAISVMLLGTILAAATGIIGASVVMLAVMALPTMLSQRYDPSIATGTVAAAGCLGILIPPSIMLVIMADMLTTSAGRLFMGAVLPGVLLSSLYIGTLLLIGILAPSRTPRTTAKSAEPTTNVIVDLILALLAPVALISLVLGSIIAGWATPTEAAAVGASGALSLALLQRQLSWKSFCAILDSTSMTCAMIFFVFVGASVFSYAFNALGGDDLVLRVFVQEGQSGFYILGLFLLLIFVLGFFLDWIEICLILLPILGPIIPALDLGMDLTRSEALTWFAILVAVVLQTSFLTPPFAFALFFIKAVAPPEVTTLHLYKGVIPFVGIQLFVLALILFFPDIALYLPRLVFQ